MTEEVTAGPAPPATRRSSRWKVALVALLVLVVLAAATWVLLGSRLLVVRHIDVTGIRLLSRDRVLAAARIRLGESMVRLNTDEARGRIAAEREVEAVSVRLRWPATVLISVRERTPIAAVRRGNGYWQIDRYGVTVLTSSSRPRGLPALTVADPARTDPALRAGLDVVRVLPPWLTRRLTGVEAPSPQAVTLRLTGGVSVVWGDPGRAPAKLRLLHGLLVDSPRGGVRTIDVSSPEVVTTK